MSRLGGCLSKASGTGRAEEVLLIKDHCGDPSPDNQVTRFEESFLFDEPLKDRLSIYHHKHTTE